MKRILFITSFYFLSFFCFGQSQNKRVLFLGNSYTYVNNLPQLIADAAQSTNDNLIFDSNTIGGYTLEGHNSNATSLAKIAQGNWDFVVLQEQSQLPSYPINQVQTQVFPYAQSLNNLITTQNPCAETAFYMTWGRQNGDIQNCAVNPSVCTYEGMDDLLKERYMTMTLNNEAIVSPVGAVWRFLRTNYPLLNLYSSDGSHPSEIGSYAAACAFYVTLFRKDPTLITFNSTLSLTDATTIKTAAKNIVFDHLLDWKIGSYDAVSNFSYANSSVTEVYFTNTATYATDFLWDFGDTTTSTETNPIHTYSTAGQYTVTLTVSKCGMVSSSQQTINTLNLSNNQAFEVINAIKIYPNPVTSNLSINSIEKIKSLELFDIQGRLTASFLENNENVTFDFSDKKTGVYFLKIYTDNAVKTEKVIKE